MTRMTRLTAALARPGAASIGFTLLTAIFAIGPVVVPFGTAALAQAPPTIPLPSDVIAGAPAAAVAETTVRIPIPEAGPGGARRTLEATLYRPAGAGPHPVLLFNHGSTGRGSIATTVTLRRAGRRRSSSSAASRCLRPCAAAAAPRTGRRSSWRARAPRQTSAQASSEPSRTSTRRWIYVRSQPWADSTRVVVAGQSRGGILSVAYAAKRPAAARAVINFAGGWTGDYCDRYDEGFNAPTFAAAEQWVRVPTLWLYAEGDRYYGAASIRRYHEAFARAGGTATFRLFPDFGSDGHRLVDRVDLWGPAVDEFLRGLGLSAPR